mgnify:CR=1 FL=1
MTAKHLCFPSREALSDGLLSLPDAIDLPGQHSSPIPSVRWRDPEGAIRHRSPPLKACLHWGLIRAYGLHEKDKVVRSSDTFQGETSKRQREASDRQDETIKREGETFFRQILLRSGIDPAVPGEPSGEDPPERERIPAAMKRPGTDSRGEKGAE